MFELSEEGQERLGKVLRWEIKGDLSKLKSLREKGYWVIEKNPCPNKPEKYCSCGRSWVCNNINK